MGMAMNELMGQTDLALRLDSGLLQHLDSLLLLLHHLRFVLVLPQELSVPPFSVLQLLVCQLNHTQTRLLSFCFDS